MLKLPRSPLTTRLSGSARETEHRIRSIFQWKKRRPPVPVLALAALVIVLCGSLVSCRQSQPAQPASDQAISVPVSGKITIPDQQAQLYAQINPAQNLSEGQRALLDDLPVQQLPREAVDSELSSLFRSDIWQDTLLPLFFDPETDTTLYLVTADSPLQGVGSRIGLSSNHILPAGVVLRHGDRAAYFPLVCDVHYGLYTIRMEVSDFNGDGREEAAVSMHWSRGVGAHLETLHIFDLESLTYSVPDFSALEGLRASYDPQSCTATMEMGRSAVTVPLPEYCLPLEKVSYGDQVHFVWEYGRLFCQLDFSFSQALSGFLVRGTAPLLWDGERWQLGEMALSPNFEYYGLP